MSNDAGDDAATSPLRVEPTAALPRVSSTVEVLPARVGTAVGSAVAAAGGVRDTLGGVLDARVGPRVTGALQTLDGVVVEGRYRGLGAIDALAGRRAPRRWPWAAGAAALGALVGAGLALALRGALGQDAPDAQEPEQLQAVVDPFPGDPMPQPPLG